MEPVELAEVSHWQSENYSIDALKSTAVDRLAENIFSGYRVTWYDDLSCICTTVENHAALLNAASIACESAQDFTVVNIRAVARKLLKGREVLRFVQISFLSQNLISVNEIICNARWARALTLNIFPHLSFGSVVATRVVAGDGSVGGIQ